MKTTLTALAAVLTTLCIASTALGQTTPPASGDAPQPVILNMPQFYFSVTQMPIEPPRFIQEPERLMVCEEGQNVKFEMVFSGHPDPTVMCYYNMRPIDFSAKLPDNSPRYIIESSGWYFELTIRSVEMYHSGEYQFKLINTAGEDMAYSLLNVMERWQ